MASLLRTLAIKGRRHGWTRQRMTLALLAMGALSVVIATGQGPLATFALTTAFLVGAAARSSGIDVRGLVSLGHERPSSRDEIKLRIAARLNQHAMAGALPHVQAMCLVIELDDCDEHFARHGQVFMSAALEKLTERLYAEIRHNDTLAILAPGRFAVFMPPNPRIDLETAVQTTMRLHAACARPLTAANQRLHLTCCAGFAITPRLPLGQHSLGLLDAAEIALDYAQQEGPRTVRAFDQTMVQRPKAPIGPTRDLDVADGLAQGEILPWFQPQICADTGALTGLEALVRWQHSERGLLAPGQFLNAVRDQGQASHLTETMIAATLAQLRDWDRTGLEIPRVSVNVGTEDLADPTFADRVRAALSKAGLPARRLGIEVLETVVARADPDDMASRNLMALGRMGCLIDLDDFGTGSASINGIRRFSVNRIKIDRSLVTSVDTDLEQHAMISAILTMAAQLGVDVLAEGVETPGEYSTVAQLGCGHVQGYAVARPMSARDLTLWILRRAGDPSPVLTRPPGLPGHSPRDVAVRNSK